MAANVGTPSDCHARDPARTPSRRLSAIGVLLGRFAAIGVLIASRSVSTGFTGSVPLMVLGLGVAAGYVLGSSSRRDICSGPSCGAHLPNDALKCPKCAGTVRGEIKSATEHFAALETLRPERDVVEAGNIAFVDKVNAAVAAGAIAVIIYNNRPGGFIGELSDEYALPVLGVSKADGETLLGKAGQSITVIAQNGVCAALSDEGGGCDPFLDGIRGCKPGLSCVSGMCQATTYQCN